MNRLRAVRYDDLPDRRGSASEAFLAVTEDKRAWVAKTKGRAAELIGHRLARLIDAPTPEFDVLEVPADVLPMASRSYAGLATATRYVEDGVFFMGTTGPADALKKNDERIACMCVMHGWFGGLGLGSDTFPQWVRAPNGLLWAIDFEHYEHPMHAPTLARLTRPLERGLSPEAESASLRPHLARLAVVTREQIATIVDEAASFFPMPATFAKIVDVLDERRKRIVAPLRMRHMRWDS